MKKISDLKHKIELVYFINIEPNTQSPFSCCSPVDTIQKQSTKKEIEENVPLNLIQAAIVHHFSTQMWTFGIKAFFFFPKERARQDLSP